METKPPTLDEYLAQVAMFVENDYGKLIRGRFQDRHGSSELAMLTVPTADELEELKRAVAIMTTAEKKAAASLTDEQMQRIAQDAQVDAANWAIFLNGFALKCKRVSCPPTKGTEI